MSPSEDGYRVETPLGQRGPGEDTYWALLCQTGGTGALLEKNRSAQAVLQEGLCPGARLVRTVS